MTESLWRARASAPILTCDLAIVGGGIAGISCALHAQRSGASAIVTERGDICCGASSRNAGFLMRGAADNYAAAVESLRRAEARRLWKMTEDNLAALRNEGIESLPSYQRVPSALLALTESEAKQLTTADQLLAADGFDSRLLESGSDAVWRTGTPILALLNPKDAAINPVDLVQFLAAKLTTPPLTQCTVRQVDANATGVTLKCDTITIKASRAIVCTNACAADLLSGFSKRITPNRGQMLALKVPGPMLDCSYYANHGGEYFRQPDPTTIVAGGWRRHFVSEEQTDSNETTDNVQSGIESFIRDLLPLDGAPVIARWAGIMGFTPDGLPIAGPIDEAGRIWTCAGFTGHGMSLAFETARRTVEAVLAGGAPPFPLNRLDRTPAASG